MRSEFPGYYRPTDDEFAEIWREALVVPDANVLLNLYRYSERTRGQLLSILRAFGDRLFIAYQTAREFQDNRLNVIDVQRHMYDDFLENLRSASDKLRQSADLLRRHPHLERDIVAEKIDAMVAGVTEYVEEIRGRDPDVFAEADALVNDPIREEVDRLVEGRLGPPFTRDELAKIFEQGKRRYEQGIPPGFRDRDKPDPRRYGDLVFWLQVVEAAKSARRPVILITDERKEDWWWGTEDGRLLGPRPELVNEMREEAGVRLYMYSALRFMEEARRMVPAEAAVSDEAIAEVERLQESNIEAAEPLESLWRPLSGVPREAALTASEVLHLTGLSYRQLDYWARTGLVRPSVREAAGPGARRLYGREDLVRILIIKGLLDAGLSLQRIRNELRDMDAGGGETLRRWLTLLYGEHPDEDEPPDTESKLRD